MSVDADADADVEEQEKVELGIAKPGKKKIPLMELFGPTIQGEGSVIGQQSYFMRFGLCDYRCTMCDSLHAVLPRHVRDNAEWLTQEEILTKFLGAWKPDSTSWVTFSGGNPCLHNLGWLAEIMRAQGFHINVETQGTLYQDWLQLCDSITISPKGPGMGEITHLDVLDDFMHNLRQDWGIYKGRPTNGSLGIGPDFCFKIVVFDQRDLDFAAEMFSRYKEELTDVIAYDRCYLSLGNPNPPSITIVPEDGMQAQPPADHFDQAALLQQYRVLFEDIQTHPILSHVKFLPQWHTFVWGNGQGH